MKPAAPPVVAPRRAPILPVALARALAYRPRWIAETEIFFGSISGGFAILVGADSARRN